MKHTLLYWARLLHEAESLGDWGKAGEIREAAIDDGHDEWALVKAARKVTYETA